MIVNRGGELREAYPDHYTFTYPVPAEAIPLMHFYPNNLFLAVGSAGCNFMCRGCISRILTQYPELFKLLLRRRSPKEVVDEAVSHGCIGIAFILNEPAVSYWSFMRLAAEARRRGLIVGLSSNLYFTVEALRKLIPLIDFACVGIKGRSRRAYLKVCGGGFPEYVFRNLRILYRSGVHVEVLTPYLKGMEGEVLGVAEEISRISDGIPFQVLMFQAPTEDLIRLEPSVGDAVRLCGEVRRFLKHVYLLNTHGTDLLNTKSVSGEVVIRREFYGPCAARLVWAAGNDKLRPLIKGFVKPVNVLGSGEPPNLRLGYRITGALESAIATLEFLGVDRGLWGVTLSKALSNGFPEILSKSLNNPEVIDDLIKPLEFMARASGVNPDEHPKITYVRRLASKVSKTGLRIRSGGRARRAYVVLGHPLYAKKDGTYQVFLTELVGCDCINRYLRRGKFSGVNASAEELEELNPELIFIDSHSLHTVGDFMEAFNSLGINVDAVKYGRVYKIPRKYRKLPYWPLIMTYVAVKSYPEVYPQSLHAQAESMLAPALTG